MRKQLVSGKKMLLFVDTGDNCRCPLAIGYLLKLLQQKGIDYLDVRHMGVMTPNDLLPTPEVVQLLKEEGVDIRYHRSRPINADLINQADLILGFTAIHVQTCYRRVPECKSKTFLLKEYVGLAHTGDQIHDPMGSTMEIFKKYFNEIKQSLQRLVEMEFVTMPPEPKEVVIAPTIVKPRSPGDEDGDLPAGYYNENELAVQAEKAAKAKRRLKALMEEAENPEPAPTKKKDKAAKPEKKAVKASASPKSAKKDPAEKSIKAKPADKVKAEKPTAKVKAETKAAKPGKESVKPAKAKADSPKVKKTGDSKVKASAPKAAAKAKPAAKAAKPVAKKTRK